MIYLGDQAVGVVANNNGQWVRPYDWPNLDVIDYTNFEGGYFTFDLNANDYVQKWAGFYISPNQQTTECVIERGHLDNNVFVSDEQYTFTGNYLRTALDPQNGSIQLFRVSGTGLQRIAIVGNTTESTGIIRAWDCPCVEIYLRLPNASGAMSSDPLYNLNNYVAFSTNTTRHIILIDFGKNVTSTIDFSNAFRNNGPTKIDVVGSKPKVSNINRMFNAFNDENTIDLSNFDLSNCKNLGQAFNACCAKKIILSNTGLANPTNLDGWCDNTATTYLDLSGCDFSESNYTNLYLPINIVDFYPPTFGAKNYGIGGYMRLSVASLLRIIDALPTVESTCTITLNINKHKLTTEQIAVATAKGWTVA